MKTSEEDVTKYRSKNNNNLSCPLYVLIYDMDSCKVMQVQDKYMERAWSYACGGVNHVKFEVNKKRSDDGKEINIIVDSAVAKSTKMNNKSKATDNYYPDNDQENFNFENLGIGADSNLEREQRRKQNLSKPNVYTNRTLKQCDLYYISKIINPTKNNKIKYYTPVILGEINC